MSLIQTASGIFFNLKHPDPSLVSIVDIAHGLSHLCRFTGHTNGFYSVAEHSVKVSRLVPEDLALEGLLHDASEAYVGDMASPLKALLPEYRRIEWKVQHAIARAFDLEYPFDLEIHRADRILLATERRDLMPVTPAHIREAGRDPWAGVDRYGVLPARLNPLCPDEAKEAFLERYDELLAERQERREMPRRLWENRLIE